MFKKDQMFKTSIKAFALVLFVLVTAALLQSFGFLEHRNSLDLSSQTEENLEISLVSTNQALYGSSSIVPLRVEQLEKYPTLSGGRYIPSKWLFSLVKEEALWSSLFSEINRRPGLNERAPAENLSLFNPLLLLRPKFYRRDNSPTIPEYHDVSNSEVGKIVRLVYKPKDKTVELTCLVSEILINQFGTLEAVLKNYDFGLVTYNALDLGFTKGMILSESNNVVFPITERPTGLISLIGYSENGCGPKLGCNTLKMILGDWSSLKLNTLPATLAIALWKDPQVVPNQTSPDLRYVINFL